MAKQVRLSASVFRLCPLMAEDLFLHGFQLALDEGHGRLYRAVVSPHPRRSPPNCILLSVEQFRRLKIRDMQEDVPYLVSAFGRPRFQIVRLRDAHQQAVVG